MEVKMLDAKKHYLKKYLRYISALVFILTLLELGMHLELRLNKKDISLDKNSKYILVLGDSISTGFTSILKRLIEKSNLAQGNVKLISEISYTASPEDFIRIVEDISKEVSLIGVISMIGGREIAESRQASFYRKTETILPDFMLYQWLIYKIKRESSLYKSDTDAIRELKIKKLLIDKNTDGLFKYVEKELQHRNIHEQINLLRQISSFFYFSEFKDIGFNLFLRLYSGAKKKFLFINNIVKKEFERESPVPYSLRLDQYNESKRLYLALRRYLAILKVSAHQNPLPLLKNENLFPLEPKDILIKAKYLNGIKNEQIYQQVLKEVYDEYLPQRFQLAEFINHITSNSNFISSTQLMSQISKKNLTILSHEHLYLILKYLKEENKQLSVLDVEYKLNQLMGSPNEIEALLIYIKSKIPSLLMSSTMLAFYKKAYPSIFSEEVKDNDIWPSAIEKQIARAYAEINKIITQKEAWLFILQYPNVSSDFLYENFSRNKQINIYPLSDLIKDFKQENTNTEIFVDRVAGEWGHFTRPVDKFIGKSLFNKIHEKIYP